MATGLLLAVLVVITFRQSGAYVDGESIYRATLLHNPDSWMAHNNLGILIAKTPSRLPEAIAEYEAALRLKPDFAEAHTNLGTAIATLPGRLPEAVAHFEAALRANPDFVPARNNLRQAQRMLSETRSEVR